MELEGATALGKYIGAGMACTGMGGAGIGVGIGGWGPGERLTIANSTALGNGTNGIFL